MIPGHVRTIDDYWLWIDQLIDESGGFVDGGVLIVEPVEEDGRILGLVVRTQAIHFFDRATMYVAFAVADDLTLLKFAYHYQTDDGTLIWRIDDVGDHLGNDVPHIHRRVGLTEVISEWTQTNLDEALEFQRTGPPGSPPIPPTQGTFL